MNLKAYKGQYFNFLLFRHGNIQVKKYNIKQSKFSFYFKIVESISITGIVLHLYYIAVYSHGTG